jgi:hypothetical protein
VSETLPHLHKQEVSAKKNQLFLTTTATANTCGDDSTGGAKSFFFSPNDLRSVEAIVNATVLIADHSSELTSFHFAPITSYSLMTVIR